MYVLASRHVCAMTFYLLSHLIDPASVFHYHKLNLSISLLGYSLLCWFSTASKVTKWLNQGMPFFLQN